MANEQEDVLYNSLLAQANNPRLKVSIERVKKACDFLVESRAEVTPTSVGRYCEELWGGPKMQSIRNARGTLLRYVETRKGAQRLPGSSKRSSNEPLIEDETLRAFVSILKAERDEAIRLKNRIIGGLRKIPGVPIDELISTAFNGSMRAPVVPANVPHGAGAVSPDAVAAVRKLLDDERLGNVGLELHKNRLRHSVTGEVLLDKAEVDALKALLPNSGASQELECVPASDNDMLALGK